MFLYTSSNSLMIYVVFFLNISANRNLTILSGSLLRSYFFILLLPVLLSMVKAYSLKTFICHTTDILNCYFIKTVHWIKPPSLYFHLPDISPTYEISFFNSLSRQDIVGLFWIDFIIALRFLFVNTISLFFIY